MNVFFKATSISGSVAELCRQMSKVEGYPRVSVQVFNGWKKRNQVPRNRVWQLSAATGIPPWEIRPDLYDRPERYLAKVSRYCCKKE